jgi:hypothetical protein
MSNENTNNETDIYPLDEAAITLLADIRTQMRMLEAQFQGALVLFIRQQKLTGNWQVSENGREIVKVQQNAPVALPQN